MRHITVLFVLALTAGGLTGCTIETQVGTPSAGRVIGAPTADLPPKEALLAAVNTLGSTAYTFEIKQGAKTGGGRIDPADQAATMSMGGRVGTIDISVAYTVIAPELWVKADFGAQLNKAWGVDAAHWMRVDRSKVGASATLPIDPAGAPRLGITELCENGLGEVERTDATHYKGTIDVTAADTILAPPDDAVRKAGAKAKAVPFTATVDAKGRLTEFAVDGDAIDPELSIRLTFAGFGSVQPVTEPAGAIPAPDSVYELFE
ncbi:hypothetical protein ACQEVZ_48660 [Dactylosporangium sp. CA-152071]|uniref:hypothetical protein n=1 Tax=Dactylosporangium sp. CA-152071 TaxID=3239933 RepID=UPI003D8DB7BB